MSITAGVYRIGRDAEVRYVPSGEAVINLSLAENYGRKGEDGKRPTQWVEAGLWGKMAESLGPHLTRGKQVFVTMENVHEEKFTKADGTQGHKWVGRINSLEFVGTRDDGGQQQERQAPATRGAPPARQAPASNGSGFDDMDDDIPF